MVLFKVTTYLRTDTIQLNTRNLIPMAIAEVQINFSLLLKSEKLKIRSTKSTPEFMIVQCPDI